VAQSRPCANPEHTDSINACWLHLYHIGQVEVAEVILEPRVGGRWFERRVDGSECDWGRVLTWDPPQQVVRTVVVTAEEDPGVPWCVTTDEPPVGLLLKSGNFGRPDLVVRATEGVSA
jgi:hypothetical protein